MRNCHEEDFKSLKNKIAKYSELDKLEVLKKY